MSASKLGRLKKVDLREAWLSECSDFTPWLAQEENLKLLSETIGIDLELESQEKEVGPFRADILCKDTANDNWVLIENQLERTDHCHLGQLLTYAAGLNAVTIVWIAERFTEEHRATLDWLNERTDEHINFFGLEVELWQIGESPIAPKFNVISQPNDWSRTVRTAAEAEVSPKKLIQQEFWAAFADFMSKAGGPIKCTKPLPQHWMSISIGRSGFKLAAIVSSWNSITNTKGAEIRADLYISDSDAKKYFAALESQKTQIEAQLGFPLTWKNPENKSACRLFTRQDADFTDRALWPQQFNWLKDRLERMHKVFAPLVRTLKIDSAEEVEAES